MEIRNKDSPIIYICSPYSGDVNGNLERACRYSRFAVDEGCVPVTPHLYLPLFLSEETERELAISLDLRMRREMAYAADIGIPIRHVKEEEINGCLFYIQKQKARYFVMKEFWNSIQLIFAAVGGWLGWFLGGCDGLLYALLLFVVLDYLSGVACAIVDHKLSSEVGFKGLFRKVLIFSLVGIGHALDTQVIGTGSVLRTAVIFFYLSNEGVSLMENAAHLGLPIPEKLKAVLEQLHDRAEKDDE